MDAGLFQRLDLRPLLDTRLAAADQPEAPRALFGQPRGDLQASVPRPPVTR
jgi:hypothetical protein